jgi:hypothetical protein
LKYKNYQYKHEDIFTIEDKLKSNKISCIKYKHSIDIVEKDKDSVEAVLQLSKDAQTFTLL